MHLAQQVSYISEMLNQHYLIIYLHVTSMERWYYGLKIPTPNGTLKMVKLANVKIFTG